MVERRRVSSPLPRVCNRDLLAAVECHRRIIASFKERLVKVDSEGRVQACIDIHAYELWRPFKHEGMEVFGEVVAPAVKPPECLSNGVDEVGRAPIERRLDIVTSSEDCSIQKLELQSAGEVLTGRGNQVHYHEIP